MLNTREGLSDPGDFEKPFRDKLIDLESAPPQESWGAIQTALDHDRGIDRRWYLLVLLLLVGSGGFIGGYWVSRVGMEQLVIGVKEGSKFQIPDSKFQKLGQEQPVGEDRGEICADDVAGTNADEGVRAKSVGAGMADCDDDQFINDRSNTICAIDSGGVLTGVTEKRMASSERLAVGKDVSAGQRPSGAGHFGGDTVYIGTGGAPGYSVILPTSQTESHGHTGTDEGSDSTLQMVDGPMRPFYPRLDGVLGVAVAGVDSVQKENELAAMQPLEQADSLEEKKTAFESSKWTVQLSAGGSYVFKKLTPAEDLYYIADLTNKNEFSWGNSGYHLAARLRREINARTTLMAGVSWSRWQAYIGYNYYDVVADSVAVQQITANSIEVNTYFTKRSNEIHSTVQQVGLSVGVLQKIRVLQRSHTILLEASLYQKIYTATQTGEVGHNASVRSLHFAIKTGVEKTVDIGAWRFTLTPYIQRYLGSLYTADSLFQFSPIQAGLDVGLLLPLQKK